jgi:hypothetical protein
MTLGEQFASILRPRLDLSDIEMDLARRIDKQMKENVDEGQGFIGKVTDRYDRNYEPKYARKREKQGFQIEYTDLQKRRKRIKNTIIEAQDGAVISFVDGGEIFKYHHDGVTYANGKYKERSIFPKEGTDSIPKDILVASQKLLTAKLRG